MIISAKFPSVCPKCSHPISVGTQIEWTKGSKATHAKCPGAEAKSPSKFAQKAAPKTVSRAPKSSYREPKDGERQITARSVDRDDRYEIGEVRYIPKVSGGGGEDGHWFTVVAEWKSGPNEDNQKFDWTKEAIVRAATPEEVEVASKERDAQKAAALLEGIPRRIADFVQNVENSVPYESVNSLSGAWSHEIRGNMAGSETLYVTADSVIVVKSSYDDGPWCWKTALTPELIKDIEIFKSGRVPVS